MKTSPTVVRRGLASVLTACAIGGAVAAAVAGPSASAAPDPCMASQVAKTIGSVATNTGSYLDTHPQTNAVFTMASKQQAPQAVATLKTYLDANPQVGKDIQTLQQPLTSLAGQCDLPITLPQVMTLMQAATQAQAAGSQQVAGAVPGVPAPATQLPAATGPLPGPSAVSATGTVAGT